METIPDDVFRGIKVKIRPSHMIVEPDGTVTHVITTHVGRKLGSEDCWTEGGVVRWLSDGVPTQIRIFTYDNDEGGYKFHGTTDYNTFTTYQIYVTDQVDAWGYIYNTFINGKWVRSGHLWYRENNVDLSNEVWSDTGSYTDDIGEAKHDDPFLYAGEYGMWWDDSLKPITDWWHAPVNGCPVKERHQMEGSSYAYWTWVD